MESLYSSNQSLQGGQNPLHKLKIHFHYEHKRHSIEFYPPKGGPSIYVNEALQLICARVGPKNVRRVTLAIVDLQSIYLI